MVKDFNQIGCIFCGNANIKQDDYCKNCKKPLSIQKDFEEQKLNSLILAKYKARGFYGLTYQAIDSHNKPYAVKLISKPTYLAHGKDFIEEADAYADLPDHPCIARYIGTGEKDFVISGEKVSFYFITSEWIEGPSLKEWFASKELTPQAVNSLAIDLLTAVAAFEEKNLWHNDLHEENILVAALSDSQRLALRRDSKQIFKVVDIGSARFRAEGHLREVSDLAYVGRHLATACKYLSARYHLFSKEDQEFIRRMETTCVRLTDEDHSRGFRDSMDALNAIKVAWEQSRLWLPEAEETLSDPYGLINAMDIHSPKLIRDMFSDEFKYFDKISSINNHCILITGPRGCGKTMILKRMSFETALISEGDNPKETLQGLEYIGFYISARTEFGNYLVAVREPEWVKNQDTTGLYFNCLITLKAIDILYQMINLGIESVQSVQTIIDFIVTRFDLPPCDLLSCRNQIVDIIRTIVLEDLTESVKANALNATPAYLNDLVNHFTGTLQALRGEEVVLLIDDLSWPRIPTSVMKILAPFLFNTGSQYKVRVSAHSDGLVTTDLAGEEYKANRDYTEINLGQEYFEFSENYELCKQGFDDLMNRRFKLTCRDNFPGIETVLGRFENLKDLGAEIKALAKGKKLRSLRYSGSYVFVKLCSGDLSYLVEILGLMSIRWEGNPYPIAGETQNSVVRNYSKRQLMLLQDIKTTNVSSLYDIGMTFGLISKAQLLYHGKEHLRIEVDLSDLSEDLKNALRELLSSGLFIDGGYSTTSSGMVARRLLFRRIYTPAFPTTVNNRETVAMRKASFKMFVKDPKLFLQAFLSKHGIKQNGQQRLEMFEDDDGSVSI